MSMPSHKTITENLIKAREVSLLSNFGRARLGCIIVIGNKVISTGYNQLKTSPIQKKYNKFRKGEFPDHIHNDTLHAEIDALNKSSFKDYHWKAATLYVGRQDKAGHPRLAKPCPACIKAIKERGIKRVFYTMEDGYGFLEIK